MSVQAYHNSRLAAFRSPFGAVTCGQEVSLSLLVSQHAQVLLRIWSDAGEQFFSMEPCDMPSDEVAYEAHTTACQTKPEVSFDGVLYRTVYKAPSEPGLVWYSFVIRSEGMEAWYGLNTGTGGEGRLNPGEFHSYQMTVYQYAEVPNWYRHGVAYQIFPDRFHRGSDFLERAVAARSARNTNGIRRVLQLDWDDRPYYDKDAQGGIRRWTFFGGTLLGIAEKLPYLEKLGITVLYLNPIFEAASNHKYDTGDYKKIDPGFGDEARFTELCRLARERGIRIILDGVFNHTGCNSLYFNKYNDYPTVGAYQSKESPYYSWYQFTEYPDAYDSWWGVGDLPAVRETEPTYQAFIYEGSDSVVRHWMRAGASGWRLDVADELPDSFISGIRHAIRQEDAEALLLGEVWEDASHKVSYGEMRRYLLGDELDSVTNYPFLDCMVDFLLGRCSPKVVHDTFLSLCENYPPQNFYAALNLIGSHDRRRILTVLGGDARGHRLSRERRALALRRLRMLSLVQMTFPGVPCIYYGDEAGMEGEADPENRGPFPWGREDADLTEWYQRIIKLRKEYPVLLDGAFSSYGDGKQVYGFVRQSEKEQMIVLLNPDETSTETVEISLQEGQNLLLDLLDGTKVRSVHSVQPNYSLSVPPLSVRLLYARKAVQTERSRSAGILCPITALPTKWGIGDLGQGAREFVTFLQSAGQRIWQILPLNPPGPGNSPYASESLFAGSPFLLSMEALVQQGLLDQHAVEEARPDQGEMYETASAKLPLLRQAFRRFDATSSDFTDFVRKNGDWLENYCLYRALKERFSEKPWQEWPEGLRCRQPEELKRVRQELDQAWTFHAFVQYEFHLQWEALHRYAAEHGVKIMGDLPFYAALDSCDVWANQALFQLDARGYPEETGGVPPDYFTPEGQNWGSPVYRWTEAGCDAFWVRRVTQALQQFDFLRLDHFRGLEAYYSIPAGEETAQNGRWKKGPGHRLFDLLSQIPGFGNLLAEDLGTLTPEVSALKESYCLPGMLVYQFSAQEMGWDGEPLCCAYYSGTHDNDTLAGFLEKTEGKTGVKKRCREIIKRLYESPAVYAITPLQDVFFLGSEHRVNVPGTNAGNWQWQIPQGLDVESAAAWLKEMVEESGRFFPAGQ